MLASLGSRIFKFTSPKITHFSTHMLSRKSSKKLKKSGIDLFGGLYKPQILILQKPGMFAVTVIISQQSTCGDSRVLTAIKSR